MKCAIRLESNYVIQLHIVIVIGDRDFILRKTEFRKISKADSQNFNIAACNAQILATMVAEDRCFEGSKQCWLQWQVSLRFNQHF